MMASFIPQPVIDDLEAQPAPERLYLHDGALLTQEHFRQEQLYLRGQLARLALFVGGAGTLAGFDVRYAPASGGAQVEVQVAAGMAIDRLGRIVEVPYLSCLPLQPWLEQQVATPAGLAAVQVGLRAAGDGLPDRIVADVYVAFKPCARVPEPAFATGNADTIDAVQPSRILDAGRLDLVIRPAGDDRVPSGLAASQVPDPATAEAVQRFKRERAYALTRAEAMPFSLPAGGTISEHVVAGNRQNGSEILLARLIIPVVPGDPPIFDDTIDLDAAALRPDQSLRPYAYSAAEVALLAGNVRR